MAQLEQTGNFQAQIINYGVKEFEGKQTIAVTIECRILSAWNPDTESWDDWGGYEEQTVYGDVFVVKKDGNLNTRAIESLVKCAGWDTTFDSIDLKTWKPTPCSITVEREEYNGKVRFKVGFINPFDSVPGGGIKQLPPEKVKALQSRFGSELRALKGTFGRSPSPPGGEGPSKPPAAKPAQRQNAMANSAPPPGDDIPF